MCLLNKHRKMTSEGRQFISEAKSADIDMSELFSGISLRKQTKELSDNLLRRSHPDRFVNQPQKQMKAEHIFKEVQSSRINYDRLQALELEISKLEQE